MRVSTRFDSNTGIWERPADDEPARWRSLFEQVRWPNRNVWVIPANEPNLGREWGGQVDVPSFTRYFELFLDAFAGQGNASSTTAATPAIATTNAHDLLLGAINFPRAATSTLTNDPLRVAMCSGVADGAAKIELGAAVKRRARQLLRMP